MLETNVWNEDGDTFYAGSSASIIPTLPPGVYAYQDHPMKGWWLERTSAKFEFPYKIYGAHDHIVNRVMTAWTHMKSNLGILLNGVKGTGKTVSAQLIANWAIEHGYPVLVVGQPVPLDLILSKLMQPVVVIFDEFEKTHKEPHEQQALLTTLDGMGRHKFKRLFILTTNRKTVDENFIDRPSRIRYCYEFGRLEEDVIIEIVNDMLDPELSSLRGDLMAYLNTRNVLSIDVVKTVIEEVNIFREISEDFNSVLNLTEMPARGFTLNILDSDGNPIKTLSTYFRPGKSYTTQLQSLLTKSGASAYVERVDEEGISLDFQDHQASLIIRPLRPTEDPNVWVCNVCLPVNETWLSKYRKVKQDLHFDYLWLDIKPDGWRVPTWVDKKEKGESLTGEEDDECWEYADNNQVYGSGELAEVLIRIEANFDSPRYYYNAF